MYFSPHSSLLIGNNANIEHADIFYLGFFSFKSEYRKKLLGRFTIVGYL